MDPHAVLISVIKAVLPFLIFFGVIIFLMVFLKRRQQDDSPTKLPYFSKKPLTATEAIFYNRLVEALPEYIVLAQVQLCSFIGIEDKQKLDRERKSYPYLNRIAQQSVDYLICTKEFDVVAAIELDDKSHNNSKNRSADKKKNGSLDAAKIQLIRWHAEKMPTIEEIKTRLIPIKRDI